MHDDGDFDGVDGDLYILMVPSLPKATSILGGVYPYDIYEEGIYDRPVTFARIM